MSQPQRQIDVSKPGPPVGDNRLPDESRAPQPTREIDQQRQGR